MNNPILLIGLLIGAAILPLVIIGCALIFLKMTKNLVISVYMTMLIYFSLSLFNLVDAIYSYYHHEKSSIVQSLVFDSVLWFGVAWGYYFWLKHYLKKKKSQAGVVDNGA
jgi:hypothetical protein